MADIIPKHCNTCHKEEPEVEFYAYKRWKCKRCAIIAATFHQRGDRPAIVRTRKPRSEYVRVRKPRPPSSPEFYTGFFPAQHLTVETSRHDPLLRQFCFAVGRA